MKLPIEKKYYDKIEAGNKNVDFRDAHITFICNETGRAMQKKVIAVSIKSKKLLRPSLRDSELFTDDEVIAFKLEKP